MTRVSLLKTSLITLITELKTSYLERALTMVYVSQNTDIPNVSSVFLELNHLIQTIEHHGHLFPVTKN